MMNIRFETRVEREWGGGELDEREMEKKKKKMKSRRKC